MGGGAGGVVLDGVHEAAGLGLCNVRRRRRFSEVQRHQWFEAQAVRQSREDAFAVGARQRDRGHRWQQVRHDDRPGKLPGCGGQHRSKCGAIAQMQVPVVRPRDRELVWLGLHRRVSPGCV